MTGQTLAVCTLLLASACGDVTSDLITREGSHAGGAGGTRASAGAPNLGDAGPACRTTADCSKEYLLCDPVRLRCVECVTDGHCQTVGERCSTALGECAVPCTSPAPCPTDAPLCDTVIGFCVECRTDAECKNPAKPFCRRSECTL